MQKEGLGKDSCDSRGKWSPGSQRESVGRGEEIGEGVVVVRDPWGQP